VYFGEHLITRGEHDNSKRGTGFVNKVMMIHVSKRRRISLVGERKLDSP
jgi:hypothetical protein